MLLDYFKRITCVPDGAYQIPSTKEFYKTYKVVTFVDGIE